MIDTIDLSSYSLEQLKVLVERAKREISQKEEMRIQEVRSQMHSLAHGVGMSVQDLLQFENSEAEAKIKTVKFRNPINPEQTWTGRGKRPHWLRQALAEGAQLKDFAVDNGLIPPGKGDTILS